MKRIIRCKIKTTCIAKRKKGRPGKKVICINDGRIYLSLDTAANTYRINKSAITRQLKGERKKASGLFFVEITGNETKSELQQIRETFLYKIYGVSMKDGVLI